MRYVGFIDWENLRKSVELISSQRHLKPAMILPVLWEHISANLSWECHKPRLIRAYAYNGRFTPSLIHKIKSCIEHSEEKIRTDIERGDHKTAEKRRYQIQVHRELIQKTKERMTSQSVWLKKNISHCNFFDMKNKPLQFLFPRKPEEIGRIIQKGVDVQMSVDLVTHAFKNTYDVAVIACGDQDILDAVEFVKSLGKKVVIVSHPKQMAGVLKEAADYFVDLSDFPLENLDQFAPILQGVQESSPNFSQSSASAVVSTTDAVV